MDVGGLADSNASSKPPFASPGCPWRSRMTV
jgi:hypothetical protein